MELRFDLEEDCSYRNRDESEYCLEGYMANDSGRKVTYPAPDKYYYTKCPECGGRGKVLSDNGREFIDVLRFHLGLDKK